MRICLHFNEKFSAGQITVSIVEFDEKKDADVGNRSTCMGYDPKEEEKALREIFVATLKLRNDFDASRTLFYGDDVVPEQMLLDPSLPRSYAVDWLTRKDKLQSDLTGHLNASNGLAEIPPGLAEAQQLAQRACDELSKILEATFADWIEVDALEKIETGARSLQLRLDQATRPLNESLTKELSEGLETLNRELANRLMLVDANLVVFRQLPHVELAANEAKKACTRLSQKLNSARSPSKHVEKQEAKQRALPAGTPNAEALLQTIMSLLIKRLRNTVS